MALEMTSRSGGDSWPDRKAHANLAAVENSVLEALKCQHPELIDADGNCPLCVQLEYELADPAIALGANQVF